MSSKSLRLRDQPIGKREVRRRGGGGGLGGGGWGWLCCTNKEELIQVDKGYEGHPIYFWEKYTKFHVIFL